MVVGRQSTGGDIGRNRIGKCLQRREFPIRDDVSRRRRRRTPAQSIVAPVDPDGAQSRLFGRDVVMKQALSDVEQSTVTDTEAARLGEQRSEVTG